MIQKDEFDPAGTWVQVESEPRKEDRSSKIVLASETKAERVDFSTGHILRIGPKCKERSFPLNVGDRVVFRTYLRNTYGFCFAENLDAEGKKCPVFIIDMTDILFQVDEGVDVGIFSEAKSDAGPKAP